MFRFVPNLLIFSIYCLLALTLLLVYAVPIPAQNFQVRITDTPFQITIDECHCGEGKDCVCTDCWCHASPQSRDLTPITDNFTAPQGDISDIFRGDTTSVLPKESSPTPAVRGQSILVSQDCTYDPLTGKTTCSPAPVSRRLLPTNTHYHQPQAVQPREGIVRKLIIARLIKREFFRGRAPLRCRSCR